MNEIERARQSTRADAAHASGVDASAAAAKGNGASGDDGPSAARVVVEVPIRVESPNRLHAEHPGSRARRVRRERAAVREALDPFKPPPAPWRVTLVRAAPRRLDDDNAVAAMKAVRDEVASWLGVDDGDPRVRFVVEQERGSYAVRIEVRSAVSEGEP